MTKTPVLIIGGGPVGMSLSLVLSRFGIDHTIIERQPSTTDHPKARGLTARSMENLRVWGVDGAVRAGSLHPGAPQDAVALGWIQYYCESVTGRVLGVTTPETSIYSPVAKCSVAQDVVEQALAAKIDSGPHATFLRSCEFVDFQLAESGVSALIKQVGAAEERVIQAQYLVACDGAGSTVRARLGVQSTGPGVLQHMASYYYRADVSYLPHARTTASFLVFPADPSVPGGTILATDSKAVRWLLLQGLASAEAPLLDADTLIPMIRAHWGIPDLDIELIDALRWRMQAHVPKALRFGPVLLAGDAAHCLPPTGGLGLNTGLQDVHNLGWKLAFVLRGIAPEELLDTYDLERRPVAERILDWSVQNHQRLVARIPAAIRNRAEDLDTWRSVLLDAENHTHSEGLAMGYVYQSPAVIDDGTSSPAQDPRYYWPTDQPGARFPHMWVDADSTRSTIDWFDTEFVLVCGPAADAWRAAGEAVSSELGVPLKVETLPWMALPVSIDDDGAVLVRPDGHVGWRPSARTPDKRQALEAALALILQNGRK